jgi:outer membrane protein assembly factor BamB
MLSTPSPTFGVRLGDDIRNHFAVTGPADFGDQVNSTLRLAQRSSLTSPAPFVSRSRTLKPAVVTLTPKNLTPKNLPPKTLKLRAFAGFAALVAAAVFCTPQPALGQAAEIVTRRSGEDWPRFLGKTFDGKSPETGIRTDWSADRLPIVWTMPIGTGYGIGAIAGGRYFQHERVGDVERLRAVEAETGKPLWQTDQPVDYADMYGYNNGPRDTPAVDGDSVVTFGVSGRLTCRDVRDGKPRWSLDTSARYGVIQNFFGVGCSPLIHNGKVIVMVGGSPKEDALIPPGRLDRVTPNGSALVAFDLATGQEVWKVGDDLASYGSPRLMTIDDTTVILIFARDGLLAVEAETGKALWHYPHRSPMLESVNAMVPVVSGNRVLISECYEVGSVLLEVRLDGVREIWKDPPSRRLQFFRAHWSTPILVDDWIFGCSGRNQPDSDLRAVRLSDRAEGWVDRRHVRSSLLHVDGHFVVLDENGLMELIKADPSNLTVITETDLEVVTPPRALAGYVPLKPPYWAAPILSHGLLYVRGEEGVACFDLIPTAKK